MDDSKGSDAPKRARVEGGRRTQLPTEPPTDSPRAIAPRPPAPRPAEQSAPARESAPPEEVQRPSVFDALRQSETTLFEVGRVAERLSVVALGRGDAQHVVRQVVISFVAGLTLALLVAVVFAGGALQLVLGILAITCAAALGMFVSLRLVSKLAARFGARKLPGSPWLWVGAVLLIAVTGTATFSVSVWEVAKDAGALRVRTADAEKARKATKSAASLHAERADANLKRGAHIGLEKGVLYAPQNFESADGQFDLLLHFHGNTDLVEQSVGAAKLNALVAIINVGDGAEPYGKALQNPYAFDRMLTVIERRAETQLHLGHAQIRRIALSAWSAGFASVGKILGSRSQLDRVDAVLLMDSPHAKFAPGGETDVYLPSLENFLAFARRASLGQKLMVITHSAIPTEGYPSTTRTTDALLEQLSLKRADVSSGRVSPPPVDLPVAKRAFPSGERNWLNVVSRAEQGNLHVYGCTGNQKGDHIAHLAQMSVTVLPPLRERWK